MKNNVFKSMAMLALAAMPFFTSCKKDVDVPVRANSQAKIDQMSSVAVTTDQKEMFRMLSAAEKQAAWLQHLQIAKAQLGTTLQKGALIDSLISFITAANPFEEANADYRDVLAAVKLKNWDAEARSVFSQLEIIYITNTLLNTFEELEGIVNGGGSIFSHGGGGDKPMIPCECHSVAGSTIFCSYVTWNISANPSVEIKQGICPAEPFCFASVDQ